MSKKIISLVLLATMVFSAGSASSAVSPTPSRDLCALEAKKQCGITGNSLVRNLPSGCLCCCKAVVDAALDKQNKVRKECIPVKAVACEDGKIDCCPLVRPEKLGVAGDPNCLCKLVVPKT